MLRLDPVADRDEYNTLMHLQDVVRRRRHRPAAADAPGRCRIGGDSHPLADRIENLGVLDWEVWAGDRPRRHRRRGPAARCHGARPRRVLDARAAARRRALAARRPLGAPRGAPARAARDRRGAQPLLAPARLAARGRGARADRADRGRGPQVRAVAAAVDPAPVEGASRDPVAVRQPRPDEDDLAGRPRRARHVLRLRAARRCSPGRRGSARARRCSPAASCRRPRS